MSIYMKFSRLTDQELISNIKDDQDYLGEVYKRCKTNSISFMMKMTNGQKSDYELEDIFHDAVIVLYEKIVNGGFELTSAIQTYLNSVCRFKLLNTIAKENLNSEFVEVIEDENDDEHPLSFKTSIIDQIEQIEQIEDSKESQFNAIEKALEKMKLAGGNCFELLTLFWYQKKTMIEMTEIFGYTNKENTKNQKAKCQKRLEKMTYDFLNN